MAIPKGLKEWGAWLDPSDRDRFFADLVNDPDGPLLGENEVIASFVVSLQTESQAVGLTIEAGAGWSPALIDLGRKIQVGLSIAPDMRGNAIFDGDGIQMPVTFTITLTDGAIRQRSLLVRIRQQ